VCLGIWLLYLENLNAHEWSEMKEKYNNNCKVFEK